MNVCRDLGVIVSCCEAAALCMDGFGPKTSVSSVIGETMALAAPGTILEPEDIRIVLVHMGWLKKLKTAYGGTRCRAV